MPCERCRDTGVDPHAYIVQRDDDGLHGVATAPCPECQPDDEAGPDEEQT